MRAGGVWVRAAAVGAEAGKAMAHVAPGDQGLKGAPRGEGAVVAAADGILVGLSGHLVAHAVLLPVEFGGHQGTTDARGAVLSPAEGKSAPKSPVLLGFGRFSDVSGPRTRKSRENRAKLVLSRAFRGQLRRLEGRNELLGARDDLHVAAGARAGVLGRASVAVGEPGPHDGEPGKEEMGGLLDGMVLGRGGGGLVRLGGFVGVCHTGAV
jgi:hypothetical protein